MSLRLATLTLLVATLAPIAHALTTPVAQTCQGTRSWVPVVELYTSQGCSSCPPADDWLRSLTQAADAQQVVPLAFHVDYWDYLGWRDPFSSGAHSARQRRLARAEGGSVVYTPQVRLSGDDFRGWRSADTVRAMLARKSPKPAGDVMLSLDVRSNVLKVDARTTLPGDAVGYVAVYERMLGSKISGGENAGRTLAHDFVVRTLIGPFAPDAQGRFNLMREIALDPSWKRADLGVALLQADADSGAARLGASLALCVAPERLSALTSSAPRR
ncbi:hypothetical protein BSY238_3283 [Methyloversatilis sp. RAC08]|uniref:DUF1223 domain-containing protein n=1 Tax=Methyloversatilis sp. RAC08 TaxID=1842540 RepID=UPI00083CCA92|nr:DUF1223 domain-containing protein [Methyloversatilis sp. RAC08]AOF81457.1 hypothetical protein BSY238_3283 [Methyloversatilis sp. RAC08]